MATWVGHPELLAHWTVSCVDGRAAGEVIGTPGGTLGELVAVLSAHEALGRVPLGQEAVADVVNEVRRVFGRMYHHSDEPALRGLPDVRSVAPADREAVLERLLTPEHTGCGHLSAMLRDPEAYGVRRELVQDVLRAFFAGLWRGDEGYVFEVLDGHHDETEVLTVHSCGQDRAWGRTHALVPGDTKAFVYHRDAARWYRRQLCLLVAEGEWMEAAPLFAAADAMMGRHLAETLRRLAASLPHRELLPPCAEAG